MPFHKLSKLSGSGSVASGNPNVSNEDDFVVRRQDESAATLLLLRQRVNVLCNFCLCHSGKTTSMSRDPRLCNQMTYRCNATLLMTEVVLIERSN
jgi:hypothetical protein